LVKFQKQYIKEWQFIFIKNPVSFWEAGFFCYFSLCLIQN
jgi:hypothetical protein